MKRRFSLPKVRMAEISQRLNRLMQKSKPRLQFPKRVQSKKHYFDYHGNNIVVGSDLKQHQPIKSNIRNTMDISDIQGTKPKLIEKQKNVMNYYKNKNQQYNPFAPKQIKIQRSASEPKLPEKSRPQRQQTDSLDVFQKQIQHRYLINPESKRQATQPSLISYESRILAKKLNTDSRNPITNNSSIFNCKIPNPIERKGLAFNPTFLSNIFLN